MIVMITIIWSKNLRENPVYIMIFNLALSDITISLFVHTFTNFGNFLILVKFDFIFKAYYVFVF